MSFVIGCVTSNAVIIASDGRCCNLDGTVKTEHYNKTRKINSNTIIGYSGSTEACEFALEQLDKVLKERTSKRISDYYADEIAQILHDIIPIIGFDEGTKVLFIVGGISHKNKTIMYSFGNTNQRDLIPYLPGDGLAYSTLSPPQRDGNQIVYRNITNGQFRHGTTMDALTASIHEMAELDPSVNKQTYFQIITRTPSVTEVNPQL